MKKKQTKSQNLTPTEMLEFYRRHRDQLVDQLDKLSHRIDVTIDSFETQPKAAREKPRASMDLARMTTSAETMRKAVRECSRQIAELERDLVADDAVLPQMIVVRSASICA
jgi:predicted RNase H-like nuclease (RuvC/YqgF family)